MEEQSIFTLEVNKSVGVSIMLGKPYSKYDPFELCIHVPFVSLTVLFTQKTESNRWFRFINNYIQ